MNNQFRALQVFVATSDASSFREAAQRLAVSPQVVTRVIKELEDAMGEPLFHRSTRAIQLTAFGQQLADDARSVLASIDSLYQRNARHQAREIKGIVRVAAPSALGREHLLSELLALQRVHEGLQIDLRLSDAISDIVDQRIDVGVRIGPLRDSRFVARPVAATHLEVVASPTLVKSLGRPTRIDELSELPTTALIDQNTGRAWPWLFRNGEQWLPKSPVFITNEGDAELEAVVAGLGFGQLPSFLTRGPIADGKLVTVLDKFRPKPWTIYVYRAQRSPVTARCRLVFDALVTTLDMTLGRAGAP